LKVLLSEGKERNLFPLFVKVSPLKSHLSMKVVVKGYVTLPPGMTYLQLHTALTDVLFFKRVKIDDLVVSLEEPVEELHPVGVQMVNTPTIKDELGDFLREKYPPASSIIEVPANVSQKTLIGEIMPLVEQLNDLQYRLGMVLAKAALEEKK
jgi:hypothetical protein